ncbi:DUF5050 domain-containing protein [Lysinibacillus sp. 3P01SB]|uniref:DUF5050 domain-containing protein n=1 Tax=Lysinibacillus sp. 3P01SB TaxID=3132284 RepID=UPI0039A6B4BF
MLKRITFLVILVVFAKPVYDEVSEFLDVYVPTENVTVETAEPIKAERMSEQQPIETANQTEQIALAAKPEKVESAEQLADAFFYHFSRLDTEFTIEYRGSTAEIERLLTDATEEAAQRDTYIAGHLSNREMEYEYSKTKATIRVTQSYLTNPQQEQMVEGITASIVSTMRPEEMTDFEKVKFVNDYIVKNTEYSEESVASSHSAYAVAHEGKGVCQGYALFAQKLLQALGMESMYVVGEVYTGGHAWNLVKVEGEWYHLDTTWNDPVPDRGTGVRYDYFLLNDRDMRVDHSWEATDYPKAESSTYSYMHAVQDSYEHGEYIYFSNSEDENKLYKLNKATGKMAQVADIRALYIVGAGDWLYFSNYSKGAYLSKIRLDGTELTTLFKEEVQDLFIEGDYVYFTAESGAKKVALEAY